MAECGRVHSSASSHAMDKSITLPPDEIFRNLENAKRFAIDIGAWEYKCFLHLFTRFRLDEANLLVYEAALPQPDTMTTHEFNRK